MKIRSILGATALVLATVMSAPTGAVNQSAMAKGSGGAPEGTGACIVCWTSVNGEICMQVPCTHVK